MTIGRRLGKTTATAVLLLITTAAALSAQTATNTSGIEGRVTDESGGVLPGVTVTISSPALQLPQLETTTDENGRYRFTTLPGGTYTVTFTLGEFQRVIRQGVNIDAGFTATLDARLSVTQIEETLTVIGQSPLVDVP